MNTDKFQNDLNRVKLILQAKGLHRNTIRDIMQILSADAVEQANDLKYDRIYTAVALAVRRAYGFGGRKTLKAVQAFDEIMKTVNAEDNTWVDLMAELKDQTGIMIRTGDGDRLIMECGISRGREGRRGDGMNDISSKKILDPCSGSRMFYFNKNNPDVLFCDNRILHDEKIWKSTKNDSVRHVDIEPDVQCDVRNLPFPDNSFVHVIFDPPHLLKVGENAWICKKYGKLPEDWRQFIRDGFSECWRVLKKDGTLIFKWNETDIPVRDILKVLPVRPVYGHRSGKASKTHWMAFVKTT